MYSSNDTETYNPNRTKSRGRREDRRRTELQKYSHPLTAPSDRLYNIITDQVVTTDVNTHQTVELGTAIRNEFIACYPEGFHHTISSKVKTMQIMTRTATVNNTPVYNIDTFFGRLLIVGQKRDIYKSPNCSSPNVAHDPRQLISVWNPQSHSIMVDSPLSPGSSAWIS